MYLDEEPTFGSSFGFGAPEPVMEWVQSDRWYLLALIRHEGIIQIGGLTRLLKGDSAVIIAPGTRVRVERPVDAAQITHFWVHFSPSAVGDFRASLPWVSEVPDLMKAIDPMFRSALDMAPLSKRRLHSVAWTTLWELSSNAAEVCAAPQVETAQQFIVRHLGSPITISDIAEAAGVSHNHLIRMFQEEFGMTPSDYLRVQRVTKACHLLLNSDESVKSIGIQVGYPSAQHFHRVVKTSLGVGPQEVRSSRRPLEITQIATLQHYPA